VSDRARVLVIDDEEGFRFFLRTGLSRRGHEVREADGGESGSALAASWRPDVAFVDLRMPDLDGLQVLARIRESTPDTAVIMMTAYATIPTAIQAIRAGAAEFLTKPFELQEAVTVLDKALERKFLVRENRRLRAILEERSSFCGIVGASPAMRALYSAIERVARAEGTVLLTGESGSGKELVARAIHARSPRAEQPYIPVHCAAIPETLLESELFGHAPGAFTGASQRKRGAFERAHGGTVFLDEISEIPLSMQVKLLRAIQEKEIQALGADEARQIDVRWIAATNRDLGTLVDTGEFREDLFFRLDVLPIDVPPLRERAGDIPLLVRHFLERRRADHRGGPGEISEEAMRALETSPWPGNVRQLENVVERVCTLATGPRIEIGDLPEELRELDHTSGFPPFKEARDRFEKRYLLDLLREASGNVSRAAEMAGMSRQSLYSKLHAADIEPRRFKE